MELVETVGRAGAGALPVTDVPSVAVAVSRGRRRRRRRGRSGRAPCASGEPAVVCRVHEDRLLFDVLAVGDAELEPLAEAVLAALA